jgi:hypothetical protein
MAAKLPDPFGVVRRRRLAARDLVDAVRASDGERFADAMDALEYEADALSRAMLAVAKLPRPSPEFQARCFDMWLRDGAHLRDANKSANSVVLETIAPADAIVCAPGQIDDRYREQEIVVEPRRLGKVNVVERFEQRPL